MYAACSRASRWRSARISRFDKCTRPRRPDRAKCRRSRLDNLAPRATDLRAARPRECLPRAAVSTVTEPISAKRMKRLKTTRATLGELLKFIGNSLVKKYYRKSSEAEPNETLAAVICPSRGDVLARPNKLLETVKGAQLPATKLPSSLSAVSHEREAGFAPAGSLWGVCFEAEPTITSASGNGNPNSSTSTAVFAGVWRAFCLRQ